jgi:hypothetical protein
VWNRRDIIRTGAAIIVTLAGWAILRLLFPSLDYFPPESLVRKLERGWFVTSGLRKATMAGYATVSLILLAVFFRAVQERWPGRGGVKGFAFGMSLGVVWSFGFLTGWAFLGTTLQAELLNSINDLIGLAVGGWLIGLAVGTDTPRSEQRMWNPWLAVLLVALGFTSVHALGARLLTDLVASAPELLLVPTTLTQFALLFGLGLWAGAMFVVLRARLPFDSKFARVAFFAFGVFGHSWTWFHVFFVIEFARIILIVLLVGLTGAVGVFAGALAYEGFAARSRKVD